MNKKALGLTFFSLISLFTFTGCKEKAKENGKTKEDYDVTNNIELSAYVGQEIEYDDVSFKITKKEGEDKYYSILEITSNNPNIKSYDIVEAYKIDLRNKDREDIITAPITFNLSRTGKTTYYDLGDMYCHVWNYFSDYCNELRIVGENINFTYHLWEDFRENGNGKTVDDYDCSDNVIINDNSNDVFKEDIDSLNTFAGVEIKCFDRLSFSNFLYFNIHVTTGLNIDLVQIYVTDSKDENKKVLFDKPLSLIHIDESKTNKHDWNTIKIGTENLSDNYYALCNQNVRYYIVTNYYTLILQNYNHIINGKTKADYDLSNLDEYESYGNSKSFKNGGYGCCEVVKDKETDEEIFFVYAFCDAETNLVRVTFYNSYDNLRFDSFDIVDAYFSDADGNNVRSCLDTPVTLHNFKGTYIDANFRFYANVGNDFEQYYALCKSNVTLHIITDRFIEHVKLIDDYFTNDGDFIDEPSESYSGYKNSPEADTKFNKFQLNEDDIIELQNYTVMGLPYRYRLVYHPKNHTGSNYPTIDIFDAYFTDENGNNKLQCINKVYRSSPRSNVLFNFLAPEYSYFLSNNKKVVLHLFTTWGNATFSL